MTGVNALGAVLGLFAAMIGVGMMVGCIISIPNDDEIDQ